MKTPGQFSTRVISSRVQIAALLILISCVFNTNASHVLSISPAQPTSEDPISISVSGNWPGGGGPALSQWAVSGQFIRIDATGVLPGIPQPSIPYQFEIDVGRLSPGQYQIDYYIEVFAAPAPPSGAAQAPTAPDASLSFQVLAAPAPIPALSAGALALLAILLVLASLAATSRTLGVRVKLK